MRPESLQTNGVSRPNPLWRTALIDRAVARRGARGVGRRRRGLRRRPDAAGGHPRPRAGLRAGGGGQPARAHPGRPDPRRCDSPRCCPHGPGSNTPPGPAATAPRCTRGPGFALLRRRRHRHRRASFADPPQRHHRRARLPPLLQPAPGDRCAPWSPSPGSAGASRNPSKPPKASPGSISTRSGAGPPGTAGPPWPCSPTPSWPWPPPPNATPNPPRRADHVDRQRVSPPLRRPTPRHPATPSPPCWPGHAGDDDTNTEPANPTTDDANTNDHDLRLQY